MYIGADRGDDPDGSSITSTSLSDSPERTVRILASKPSETLDWESRKGPAAGGRGCRDAAKTSPGFSNT